MIQYQVSHTQSIGHPHGHPTPNLYSLNVRSTHVFINHTFMHPRTPSSSDWLRHDTHSRPINQPTNRPTNRPTSKQANQSIKQRIDCLSGLPGLSCLGLPLLCLCYALSCHVLSCLVLSVCLAVHLAGCLSLSVRLSICLPIYLPTSQSIHRPFYLPIFPSFYLAIFLCFCLFYSILSYPFLSFPFLPYPILSYRIYLSYVTIKIHRISMSNLST